MQHMTFSPKISYEEAAKWPKSCDGDRSFGHILQFGGFYQVNCLFQSFSVQFWTFLRIQKSYTNISQ